MRTTQLKGYKSKTECVTIRLPLADYAYIMRESFAAGANRGILTITHTMQHLEAIALDKLKGAFAQGEWQLMALAFRYEPIEHENRLDPKLMAYMLEHSNTAKVLADKYDTDLYALLDKVSALSPLGAFAVCTRIRDFWMTETDWRSDQSGCVARFNDWADY